MTCSLPHFRRGTTLVELLLFLAFFAVVGGTVVSILFATNDQRMRQQTITSVERTGLQILQSLQWRIEQAERILDPPLGASGAILALQMASKEDDPMIVASVSGALVMVLRESQQVLTANDMSLSRLSVRNTSASAARPSILIAFDLSKVYPLPAAGAREYTRRFEMLVSLFPEDDPSGCGCVAPSCQSRVYRWQVCTEKICSNSAITLPCS